MDEICEISKKLHWFARCTKAPLKEPLPTCVESATAENVVLGYATTTVT